MKELAALAYRDTTQENREFWKNELGNALREIQATYDEKLDTMRAELETYYNLKVSQHSVLVKHITSFQISQCYSIFALKRLRPEC